jgi:hypothetical protein
MGDSNGAVRNGAGEKGSDRKGIGFRKLPRGVCSERRLKTHPSRTRFQNVSFRSPREGVRNHLRKQTQELWNRGREGSLSREGDTGVRCEGDFTLRSK